MNSKKRYIASLLLLLTLLPTATDFADTGPKPSMEFTFTGEDVTIVSGILYECDQADCSDAEPLEDIGPQGLYCETTSCRATAYGFAPYHILEIEFVDGTTRASNIFETAGFDSKYKVTVNPDDLLVESQLNLEFITGTPLWVVLCCCAVMAGLLAVGGVVFFLRRRRTN